MINEVIDDSPCKYCGSNSWLDLSDKELNEYWCGDCGCKFNVDFTAKALKKEIDSLKAEKSLWIRFFGISKKQKTKNIIFYTIAGFWAFRIIGLIFGILS